MTTRREQRFLLELAKDKPTHPTGQRPKDERKDLKREEHAQRLSMQRWIIPTVVSMSVGWIIFVAIIVVLSGIDVLSYHPLVLVTLLGSATASIVGLLMKIVSHTLPNHRNM